jgi:hypothetical protein
MKLHPIRGAHDGSVKHLLVHDLARHVIPFGQEAVNRGALHLLRLPTRLLQDLVKPADLLPGFLAMIGEAPWLSRGW